MRQPTKITAAELKTIWDRLKQGYGAEDIAVMDNIPLDRVKACIGGFSRPRQLAPMYGRARAEWARMRKDGRAQFSVWDNGRFIPIRGVVS